MTLSQIIARLQTLTPDSQRQWGHMTVDQMLTHCTDQLQIVLGEKPARPRGNRLSRWVLKVVAVHLLTRMPKNLKTIPELDPNRSLMTQPSGFRQDHAWLLATLNRLLYVQPTHAFAHPVFGSMNKAEALKLSCIHLDHHLRQFGA